MRLIDADSLLKILKNNHAIYRSKIRGSYLDGVHDGINTAILYVVGAATIEERKHGHWSEEDYRCSVCGAKRPTTDTASKWIYLNQHIVITAAR